MAEPAAADPADAGGDRELWAALAGLPDGDREALLLVGWDGLSNPQAAGVAGCSQGAFKVRLHRARRRLAKALNQTRPDEAAMTDTQKGVVITDVT